LRQDLQAGSFAIAYRMLGSVSGAEDVVQEALLRLNHAIDDGERIASPQAFVATVTTRLAIDELRSARAASGTWASGCPSRSSPTSSRTRHGGRRWPTRFRSRCR